VYKLEYGIIAGKIFQRDNYDEKELKAGAEFHKYNLLFKINF
jgi:hypothetical protein